MILRWTFIAGVCAAGTLSAQSPAQTPAPAPQLTFRATTSIVEIDATVTDAKGAFVRGLARGDFQVFEDGKLQNLSVATLVDLAVERVEPIVPAAKNVKPVEPDVVTNQKAVDGRVFMIVLDGFHIAANRSALVKTQAKEFIDKYLSANDLAAVIHIGNPLAGQEFTSNRRLLDESIDRFIGIAINSATFNLVRAANVQQDAPPGSPAVPLDLDTHERAFMARESIDSMGRVARYLGGLRGRKKALLYFSEGIDVSDLDRPILADPHSGVSPEEGQGSPLRIARDNMIKEATKANVNVYAIDPRGLTTNADDMAAIGPMPDNFLTITDRSGNDKTLAQLAQDEQNLTKDSLRTFADQTGGLAFVSSNNTAETFRRIIDDNSTYYMLGYTSPDPGRGRYHRVSVKVNRPGVQVRIKTGYYSADEADVKAAAAAAADPVRQMLVSPAPLGGLGMRAQAGVVRNADGNGRVHLTVEFSGQDVALTPERNAFVNDIEIGYYALDMKGVSQSAGRHVMHLKLQPATKQAFPANGVRYVTEFDLPPGRYQVRLAAKERVAGREGSVFCDVDVPDFTKTPLLMSDLLITSSAASKTLTGQGSPPPPFQLPSQTTTAREFLAGDTLTVFAGVYDRQLDKPHRLSLTLTITDQTGTAVLTQTADRKSDEATGIRGEFPYTLTVPLQGLAAGRYVLSVEAGSSLGNQTVRKDVELVVR